MGTAQEIWDTALGELQLQINKPNFRTWLEKTRGLNFQGNCLVVIVPNTFVAEYLDKTLRSLIERTLIGIVQNEIKVSFSVIDQSPVLEVRPAKQLPLVASTAIVVPVSCSLTRLNPHYIFENFVVSSCNRLAYAGAVSVSEKPGLCAYNPLYIYGGVGLGKTHLLNAIGNVCLAKGRRVVYVTAEQFTNEFVNAIRERKTEDFRNKYRCADLLLIDDIQFISGKEQTEESFFHIFNELRDADRQIALTSNCPPNSIPFSDRLISRLKWGLSVGIQSPDFETRLAILRNKVQKEGVELNQDVLEFIARQIKENIRELEGSLNRVVAYAKLLRTMVTPELAGEALKDINTNTAADIKQSVALIPTALLLETVAHYFNMEVSDLSGKGRTPGIVLARQVAMFIMREKTDFSLAHIGRDLGDRQPIVVSQAHKKILVEMDKDSELRQKVLDIQQLLAKK
jgi:chromosomal replication initiator protein